MSYPWLATTLTTTAYGWQLERSDGIAIGFTSHDRDVAIDGLIYRASPGLTPSSIVETIGLEIGSLAVGGALTSDAINADDIEAGRWDGAALTIFLFDWSNPNASKFNLAMGTLGAINWSGSAFEVEFLGPAAQLSTSVVPLTSPTCRARFTGPGCNLSARRFSQEVKVIASEGETLALAQPIGSAPSDFALGELRWLAGQNCGQRHQVASATETEIILVEPPAFAISEPTPVSLLQGCDRTIATCASRFGNALNFRGEPYLPGNDLLTRYPGGN